MKTLRKNWPFHVMLLPSMIFLLIFSYVPMAGIVMAFQDYKPWLGFTGSEWVGLANFRYLFERQDSIQVIWNTLVIAVLKLIFNLFVPFIFAILLNEIRRVKLQRTIQTLVYLPHFLSWVILGGILIDLLATAVSNALVYMAHHHGYKLAASDSGGLDPFSAQQITGSLSKLRVWCNSVLTRIELQGTPSALEPSRSRIVKQVQEMVAESLGQDVSVKTIADRVFLHPVYLSKIYKTETGEGLGDYIIRIRMEKALYMLKHTNSKIYEITAALGYQNPQYFSKLFKKHYGMTPNEFRET